MFILSLTHTMRRKTSIYVCVGHILASVFSVLYEDR